MKKTILLLSLLANLTILPNSNVFAQSADIFQTGFTNPTGIASTADGTIYITDWSEETVSQISKDGKRSVVASGIAGAAGIALDQAGNIYISSYHDNEIFQLTQKGQKMKIAQGLSTPTGLYLSLNGELLICNRYSGEIVSLNLTTGKIKRIAEGLSLPVGITEMGDKSLLITQYGGRLTHINRNGKQKELGKGFTRPGVGIVNADSQTAYVIDNGSNQVKVVDIEGNTKTLAFQFSGNIVALGKLGEKELLVGAWGSGTIYRLELTR